MTTFKSPPRVAILAASTLVYTATADATMVLACIVSNVDGTVSANLNAWWTDASNANAVGQFCLATPVPASAAYEPIPGGFVLDTGDTIRMQASTAGDLEVSLSVVQL